MKDATELRRNGFLYHSRSFNRHSEDITLRREYQAEYRCELYAVMHRKAWEETHANYYDDWQAVNPDYHKERYNGIKKVDPGFARKQSRKFRRKHPGYYKNYWEANKEKLRKYYRRYRKRARRLMQMGEKDQ